MAEQTGVSLEMAETITTYYWREVRRRLSQLGHPRVHVTNLGCFTIKHWKLDDRIDMLEKWEEKNRLRGLQQISARFKTAETLYDLKQLRKMINEEQQRSEFVKLHKKTANESE